MKTITVRLPESVAEDIEAESRDRGVSKSDVVRERLENGSSPKRRASTFDAIAHLVGSVDGLPEDLSARTKHYLRATGFGRDRSR